MPNGITTNSIELAGQIVTASGNNIYINGVLVNYTGGGGSQPGVPQDVVYKSGNQSISGQKRFENSIEFVGPLADENQVIFAFPLERTLLSAQGELTLDFQNKTLYGGWTITGGTIDNTPIGLNGAANAVFGEFTSNSATSLGRFNEDVSVGTDEKLGRFHVLAPDLGEFEGNWVLLQSLHVRNDVDSHIMVETNRHTSGLGWETASTSIKLVTDIYTQGEIQFNGIGVAGGLALKTEEQNRIVIAENGNIGFNRIPDDGFQVHQLGVIGSVQGDTKELLKITSLHEEGSADFTIYNRNYDNGAGNFETVIQQTIDDQPGSYLALGYHTPDDFRIGGTGGEILFSWNKNIVIGNVGAFTDEKLNIFNDAYEDYESRSAINLETFDRSWQIGNYNGIEGSQVPGFLIKNANRISVTILENGKVGINHQRPTADFSTSGTVQFSSYKSGYLYVGSDGLMSVSGISEIPPPSIVTQPYFSGFEIDFAGNKRLYTNITGNVVFTGLNMADGRAIKLFISGRHNLDVTLGFPSGWAFMGIKPAVLASGKRAILSLECIGPQQTDIYAAWAAQLS